MSARETPEPGEWAYLLTQVMLHRTPDSTTVRLPNGSKTTVETRDLRPLAIQYGEALVSHPVDGIAPGDIYEDCNYHPVLCVTVDYERDEIAGISLIDGSQPRSCSLQHCGVRKLTIADVIRVRPELGG